MRHCFWVQSFSWGRWTVAMAAQQCVGTLVPLNCSKLCGLSCPLEKSFSSCICLYQPQLITTASQPALLCSALWCWGWDSQLYSPNPLTLPAKICWWRNRSWEGGRRGLLAIFPFSSASLEQHQTTSSSLQLPAGPPAPTSLCPVRGTSGIWVCQCLASRVILALAGLYPQQSLCPLGSRSSKSAFPSEAWTQPCRGPSSELLSCGSALLFLPPGP